MKKRTLSLVLLVAVLGGATTDAAASFRWFWRLPDRTPPLVDLTVTRGDDPLVLMVQVDAKDRSGVAKVLLALDGTIVAGRIKEPYRFQLTVDELPVEICAVAEDPFGNSGRDCGHIGTGATTCVMDADCDLDFYCEKPAGDCDGEGMCQPIPSGQQCLLVFMPVCGCDGRGYGNSCEAERHGVNVDFEGPCWDHPEGGSR